MRATRADELCDDDKRSHNPECNDFDHKDKLKIGSIMMELLDTREIMEICCLEPSVDKSGRDQKTNKLPIFLEDD